MLDTRNKRASAVGLIFTALAVLPAPDAAVGQADRQQVAYCYAGISAHPTAPPLVQVSVVNAMVAQLFDGDVSVTRPGGTVSIMALGGSVEVLE